MTVQTLNDALVLQMIKEFLTQAFEQSVLMGSRYQMNSQMQALSAKIKDHKKNPGAHPDVEADIKQYLQYQDDLKKTSTRQKETLQPFLEQFTRFMEANAKTWQIEIDEAMPIFKQRLTS